MKYITDINLPAQIAQIKAYLSTRLSSYLPNTGGMLTGNITFHTNAAHINGTESQKLDIGCTNGASAELYKAINNDATYLGQFKLNASDGINTATLTGTADGDILWQNNPLLFLGNAQELDTTNWTFSSNIITTGSHNFMYQYGPFVIFGFNIQCAAGTYADLITTTVTPIHTVYGACSDGSSNHVPRQVMLTTTGLFKFVQTQTFSADTWVNGFIMCLTQDI